MKKLIDKGKIHTHRLLRKSEKYFKTDMVYLARGSFWLGTGQAVSSIAIFSLAIAFANLIPQETYGTYKYVLSITGLLTILTLRGMDSAVLQSIARNFEGVLIPALKTKIRWGLLSALSSICIAIYYYINGNNTLAISFLIASGFLPFMDSFGIYNALLNGKKLFHLSATYAALSQIGSAIAMAGSLFFTKNLFIILFVYFASWTIFRFVFFVITIKKFPPNNKIDPETIPYGKHSSVVNILDAIVSSIDGLLIFHYLGPINLAVYSFSLAPVAQIRSMLGNIPTLAIPKLSTRLSSEIDKVLKKRIFLLIVLGTLLSFAYILVAPYVYNIFFPKYLASVFSSQLFSLAIALSLPQTIFGAAIASKITLIPKKMLYLSNIPGIIFIISLFLLIGTFGINGVIFSRLLSLTSGFVINYVMWERIKKNEKEENLHVTDSLATPAQRY
ncbi:MAG: oligosaccharide flippase family protein [Minisyncoccia bacterium]